MRHAFGVATPVLTQSEGIATGHVQFVARVRAGVIRQSRLTGVIPFEDTVGRYASGKDFRQFSHLKVTFVGDEAAAVSPATRKGGECDHIATLQFETLYAVVEFGLCQRVHEPAGVLQTEVIDSLTAEIFLREDGERFDVAAIGHDDASSVVDLDLAIDVVARPLPIDSHMRELLYASRRF